jgi:hypothetical protein
MFTHSLYSILPFILATLIQIKLFLKSFKEYQCYEQIPVNNFNKI